MIQVSNWSEKKCNKKNCLQALICTYFCVHSFKNARFMAIFVKQICSKTSTFAKPTEQRLPMHTCCSLKYMHGICKNITHGHKIHLYTPKYVIWSINNMKYSSHMHICVSTILWTCPQKCGHWPNTNFICKIAVVHTHQKTHIGCFLCYFIEYNGVIKYKWTTHRHTHVYLNA